MTECFSPEVRDYLPDLVHGRLGEIDTATMLAHIEACDACAEEVKLLRAVKDEARITPSVDVARIVAALPAPEVAPVVEAPPRTTPRSGAWKLIATAAVVVVAAVAGTRLLDNPAQLGLPAVSESPATAEANSTAAGAPEANASIAMVPAVDELTDEELEELLGELETIEAIPSAEPEVAAVGVSQDLGAAQ
jgi:anti-sigma factor RsiW